MISDVPSSEASERVALGTILNLAPDQKMEAADMVSRLSDTHFTDPRHREIFGLLRRMIDRNTPPAYESLIAYAQSTRKLEAAGGAAYVSDIFSAGCPGAFDGHAEILEDFRRRRDCFAWAQDLIAAAVDPTRTVEAMDRLLAQPPTTSTASTGRPLLRVYSPSECVAYSPPAEMRLIGDFALTRGSLALLAGQPGIGKSRGATAAAVAGATGQPWFGLPVHQQFKTVIIQAENGRHRLKNEFADIVGDVNLDDWIRVSEPPDVGMRFGDPKFRDAVRRAVEEFGAGLVVLDPFNAIASDDAARDYRTALDDIRAAMPKGDSAPAIMIVCHLRKPSGENRRGRAQLHELAGSHVLGSGARSVFVMEAGSDDPEDDRVVFSCCKNNDGQMPPRSAWHRRNGLFAPCLNFNWEEFEQPSGSRKTVSPEDLKAVFTDGRKLNRKRAAEELMETAGVKKTAAYDALDRFKDLLTERGGLLALKS